MKKSTVSVLAVFFAVIPLLFFLTINFFLNQNNSDFTKISWERTKEFKDNLIIAPFAALESAEENYREKAEEQAAETTEKISPPVLDVENHLVDWGFAQSNARTIDTLVVHSSYDALSGNPYSLEGLIKEYQQYGVAPHYLIDRQGVIYRLVEDCNIAYHAGESFVPDGRKNVNEFSLGIEIMNAKTDKPTQEQYTALQKLIDFLKESYGIKYVLGHNQIAPGRKDDPWNFDWGKIIK